jgi:hypothetical protein
MSSYRVISVTTFGIPILHHFRKRFWQDQREQSERVQAYRVLKIDTKMR